MIFITQLCIGFIIGIFIVLIILAFAILVRYLKGEL